jgi:GNAT superfamily N-acetyltransferase
MHGLRERFEAPGDDDPSRRLVLEAGTRRDYAAVAPLHYLAGPPATMTRVLVLRDPEPTVTARWLGPGLRRRCFGGPAAVLVESLPALCCRLREVAFGERYGGWLPAGERARLLNAEVRCISRVVVDPRWRGMGLAVRLVRHALATRTTPVTEALAAMGHVSPFFERAGMSAYRRPLHPWDARLAAALEAAGIPLQWPLRATPELAAAGSELPGTGSELPGAGVLPGAGAGGWVERELMRWWRHAAGRSRKGPGRAAAPGVDEVLRVAVRRLRVRPVYYAGVAS